MPSPDFAAYAGQDAFWYEEKTPSDETERRCDQPEKQPRNRAAKLSRGELVSSSSDNLKRKTLDNLERKML
jgi:hypothetical protein